MLQLLSAGLSFVDPNTVYWTDSAADADDDEEDPNSAATSAGAPGAPTAPGDRTSSGDLPPTWLAPSPENAAARASITANATCGQVGAEQWCKVRGGCAMCDATSPDPHKRHPARHAIDGDPDTWWQSPTMPPGREATVAVVLDLNYVSKDSDVFSNIEFSKSVLRSTKVTRANSSSLQHHSGTHTTVWLRE